MNTLIESGVIAEKIYGNNFAYILNDESQFLLTEYKVLQNQGDGCFIKCMKLSRIVAMSFCEPRS